MGFWQKNNPQKTTTKNQEAHGQHRSPGQFLVTYYFVAYAICILNFDPF